MQLPYSISSPRRRQRLAALCLAPSLAAWPVVPALGQSLPNAGSLLQQMERSVEPRLPPRVDKPRVAPLPEEMTAAPGLAVEVKQFRFAGNTLLSDARLAGAVAPWRGRALNFTELRHAAAAVAEAYRAAGWIVRAYLPRQDITDGIVTIQIVEAVFGAARVDSPTPLRLKLDRVLSYIDAVQKKGEPLSAAALDRALLLIEDVPGTRVAGSLAPGAAQGETDLVLKLSTTPVFTGDVALDNAGGRSTGAARITGNLAINSPLAFGEQFTATGIHSEGIEFLRLGATLPVGAHGWRVGANGSALRYRLVAPEFSALDARGTSTTAGLEASYPLIRARLANLFLNLSADRKQFENISVGAITTHYTTNAVTAALQGNRFDNWGGGGANAGLISVASGHVNLNGSPNQAADAATTRVQGNYQKLRYVASRRQVLAEDVQLVAAISGQVASKNLDSAEKFYLGGPNGVRAYPLNEAGGSNGTLVNLEARKNLPLNLALSGFFDWGRVTVNRNNDFVGAATVNQITLKGAGISLGWSGHGANLRGVWAHRIGDNPNPTAAGFDQDGSKVRNRFWITAGFSF